MPARPEAKAPGARAWALPALCAAAYLYAFPHQPHIGSPNEDVRLYMTAAIVEARTYRLDAIRARWGSTADNDAAQREGHVYSPKAPGTSLLGVPGYALYFMVCQGLGRAPDHAVALWVVRVTASALPTLLWLFAFRRRLRSLSDDPLLRGAVFLSVAFASPVYGYGMLFASHAQAAGAAFVAFALLREGRQIGTMRARDAFVAGLCAAGVTLFEYPGLVTSVALTAYASVCIKPRARLVPFALGALIPVLIMMHFQHCAFGDALTPGHRMSINPQYNAETRQGFFGASQVSPSAALSLLFDPGFGLFALTPLLVFAPVGFARAWRRGEAVEVVALLAACVGTVVAIAAMNNWRGGWTVGARYLCTLVPLLAWAALDGLGGLAHRAPRTTASVALGATAAGLLACGALSVYYPYAAPEITRPLSQLVAVFVAHGYAPYNLGNALGLYGTASMVPLLALGVAALVWLARSVPSGRRVSVVGGACAVMAACLGPALWPVPRSRAVDEAVALATRAWAPSGYDRAALLQQRIDRTRAPSPDDCTQLARLYRREGREREALRAERCERDAQRGSNAPRGWPFR